MAGELRRFAIYLLLCCGVVICAGGCYSQIVTVGKHPPYSLRYNVEPDNGDIYKDLVPCNLRDSHVQEMIRYARKTALEAGYPLTGPNLDMYSFNGNRYTVEITARENRGYYTILMNPVMPASSNNLQISIEKKTNRIIAILVGG